MKSYTQLTQNERYQIYALLKAQHSQAEIAAILGRHKSTIHRELKRNTGQCGYRPKQAHHKARQRSHAKRRPRFSGTVWSVVEALLHQRWSPAQIAGRLWDERGIALSHEWIYQYIYARRKNDNLHPYLRGRHRFRKRYRSQQGRRGCLRNTISIEQRPAIVERRGRVGDWEADTVAGRNQQGHLVTLVERKSGFTRLGVVARRTAQAVSQAICQCLMPLQDKVHTVTCDHGREFAEHEELAQVLGARFYFAHPYAAWERGTNENTNGLLRQYFPKSMALLNVHTEALQYAEDQLNHRPRKRLGWKTPYEVFYNTRTQLIVALDS